MVYLKKHCLKKDYFIDWHVCGNISQPPWNFSILKLKSFLTPLKFLNPTNPPPPPEKSSIPPEKFQSLLKNLNSSRKNLNPSWKILTPPEKILTPLKFLNHTKISQPPPKKKFSTPSPRKFLTPPKKKFLDPPRKFFNPPPQKKKILDPLSPKISHPPRKFLKPPWKYLNPKKYINNLHPTPIPFIFFLLLSTSFPSLSTKNLNISGGGLNPLNPLYAPEYHT